MIEKTKYKTIKLRNVFTIFLDSKLNAVIPTGCTNHSALITLGAGTQKVFNNNLLQDSMF